MAQCPSCSQPINSDDFGLVICDNCGASVMVDFDGSISSEDQAVNEAALSSPEQDDANQHYPREADTPDYTEFMDIETPDGFDSSTMVLDPNSESQTSVLQTPMAEDLEGQQMADWGEEESSKVVTIGQKTMDYEKYVEQGGEVPSGAPVEQDISESDLDLESSPQRSVSEESVFVDDRTQVIDSPRERNTQGAFVDEIRHPYDGDYESINEGAQPVEVSVGDIERYGNSNSTNEGPLLYSITISGIDSQELRERVKDALADRRLLFDVDGLMREIKGGKILLREVSSLKTHVLVNQLFSLPLTFEWGQEANGNP